MREIFLFALLFLAVATRDLGKKPKNLTFSCSNIQTKSAWREIVFNCKDSDRIISFNDYALDIGRENPDDINKFFSNKVVMGMGLKIINHMDFNRNKIKTLEFPMLEQIVIDHHQGLFEISENDELTSISMPKLKNISILHGKFEIFRNKKLVDFKVSTDVNETVSFNSDLVKNLEISGNNLLSKADNKHLLKIFEPHVKAGMHIQDEGECSFYQRPDSNKPKDKVNGLNHLSELDDCKYVYGNLLFSEGAVGEATNVHLSKVQGCVEIRNTKLKTIDFLHETVVWCASWNRITDNPYVENCEVRPRFDFSTQNTNYTNNCKGTCMPGEAMYKDKQCEFVKEGITINSTSKLYELERLQKARFVDGVISVNNTVFHEISWFTSLEVVKAPYAKGPLIEITKNRILRRVDLYALKNLTAPSGLKVHIRIKNNGNYAVPEDLYQHLLKVVGGKEKRLDVDRLKEVQKRQQEEEEKEQEEKEDLRKKIALGVGIPAGGILLIAVVVVATVIGVKAAKSKKKNKKDKKDKKDVEKGGKNKIHPGGSPTDGAKVAENGAPSVVVHMDENESVNENRSDGQKPVNQEGTVKPMSVKAVTARTIMQSKVKGPSTNYASINVKTKAPATQAVTAPPISASKMDDNYVVIQKSQ